MNEIFNTLKPKLISEINTEIEKTYPHFQTYYYKKFAEIVKCAKREKVSVDEFLKNRYHSKTRIEYKMMHLRFYTQRGCHSFWRRDCENKDTQCFRCIQFYSLAEYDKMTVTQKRLIGRS
jgi:hypothetical protein